jgi:hypothetical protein
MSMYVETMLMSGQQTIAIALHILTQFDYDNQKNRLAQPDRIGTIELGLAIELPCLSSIF